MEEAPSPSKSPWFATSALCARSLLRALFQPRGGDTLVILTIGEDGTAHERVVSRLESDGRLYVAANHWPRAWYRQALENPKVEVTIEGERGAYLAIPVSDEEAQRLHRENEPDLVFRILTGFAPRRFLRLEPQEASAP